MFNPRSKYYTGLDPGISRSSVLYSVITAVYFALVAIALTLNGIMLIVLFRLRKRLFEPPVTFYTVVVGLIAFTTLNAIVQAAFVAPQYAQHAPISTPAQRVREDDFFVLRGGSQIPFLTLLLQGSLSETGNAICRFNSSSDTLCPAFEHTFFILDTLADYGILGFSTIVAGNRLSTFSMGIKCPVFSYRPRLYCLFFLVCCAAAAFAAAPTALGCNNVASAVGYVELCLNARLAEDMNIALGAIYYVVCAGSAFLYMKTYWLIKHQRGHLIQHEGHRTVPETIILKQALVIFGIYIISLILSTILPLFSSSPSFLLSFSLNAVSLLLSSVYPALFLASCGEMRREVSSWFLCTRLITCWKRIKQPIVRPHSVSSGVKDSQGTKTAY